MGVDSLDFSDIGHVPLKALKTRKHRGLLLYHLSDDSCLLDAD